MEKWGIQILIRWRRYQSFNKTYIRDIPATPLLFLKKDQCYFSVLINVNSLTDPLKTYFKRRYPDFPSWKVTQMNSVPCLGVRSHCHRSMLESFRGLTINKDIPIVEASGMCHSLYTHSFRVPYTCGIMIIQHWSFHIRSSNGRRQACRRISRKLKHDRHLPYVD